MGRPVFLMLSIRKVLMTLVSKNCIKKLNTASLYNLQRQLTVSVCLAIHTIVRSSHKQNTRVTLVEVLK